MVNNLKPKDEGLISDKYEILIKEFQGFVSFFYLFLIGLGMLFNYYKYIEFDINIFQYSTIFDFLIAPFKDRTILLYSLYTVLAVSVIPLSMKLGIYLKTFIKRRKDKNYKFEYKKNKLILSLEKHKIDKLLIAATFFYLFFMYSSNYAKDYARKLKEDIYKQSKIEIKLMTNETEHGLLIGKTETYLFLLKGYDVEVFPMNNIKKLKL